MKIVFVTGCFLARLNKQIEDVIEGIREKTLAWKLSEAGGGGYLVMVTRNPKQLPHLDQEKEQ